MKPEGASELDLRELSCFVAVAEEAHFARAAERLGHSTSYISQRVQRLARELGGHCSSAPAGRSSSPAQAGS